MSVNKNLTREEIPFRTYTFFGVECIDTRSPRHHGWGGNIIGVTSDSLEGYLAGRAEP